MSCLVCGRDDHTHRAHTDPERVWRHAMKQLRLGNLDAHRALLTHATFLRTSALLEQLRERKGAA